MSPAMRTCMTTEERQANLSEKLARAANLLRTRVDVELERQNHDLLKSMNERTRLQLRLQTTVEGLSVAAVSYYVVGLFGYLVKGVQDEGRRSISRWRPRFRAGRRAGDLVRGAAHPAPHIAGDRTSELRTQETMP